MFVAVLVMLGILMWLVLAPLLSMRQRCRRFGKLPGVFGCNRTIRGLADVLLAAERFVGGGAG
jgi:hypothetical protein